MIIRKTFKFEGAHVVRNCSSKRCKLSIHGHSYIVEVKLTSQGLDNGGMVIDFGLLKKTFGEVVDMFDHATTIWSGDADEYKDACKKFSDRWVEIPVNASAENYALLFVTIFSEMLADRTIFPMNNGEQSVSVHSVIVHETATGYAEAFFIDVLRWNFNPCPLHISKGVHEELNSIVADFLIKQETTQRKKLTV